MRLWSRWDTSWPAFRHERMGGSTEVADYRLMTVGIFAIAVGVSVYLFDRDWGSAYFLAALGEHAAPAGAQSVFGLLGSQLPSFAHVYGFILLTAGILSLWRWTHPWVCLGWFATDSLFELLQLPSVAPHLEPLAQAFAGFPILDNVAPYAFQGHFDVLDLLAVAAGSVAAYLTIVCYQAEKHS